MKKHPIMILPQAEEDLANIWLYLQEKTNDKEVATKFCEYLLDLCHEKLAYFPQMGRERNDLRKNLRYHPVGKYNYLVFYSIQDEKLIIESIIHSSKDYRKSF